MKTVNIHESQAHLSKLIDAATKGEPFIIAKAGKPMVKVAPIDAPQAPNSCSAPSAFGKSQSRQGGGAMTFASVRACFAGDFSTTAMPNCR
jgi:prevent-host-death family protein